MSDPQTPSLLPLLDSGTVHLPVTLAVLDSDVLDVPVDPSCLVSAQNIVESFRGDWLRAMGHIITTASWCAGSGQDQAAAWLLRTATCVLQLQLDIERQDVTA